MRLEEKARIWPVGHFRGSSHQLRNLGKRTSNIRIGEARDWPMMNRPLVEHGLSGRGRECPASVHAIDNDGFHPT
jgi:hypothetical protein